MFMLLCSLFLLSNALDDFLAVGMYGNFTLIPRVRALCNVDDTSCYQTICNMLSNASICITYVALMPSEYDNLDCSYTNPYKIANMITFITDLNYKILDTAKCNTTGSCLYNGCNLFNANNRAFRILFTGRCYP